MGDTETSTWRSLDFWRIVSHERLSLIRFGFEWYWKVKCKVIEILKSYLLQGWVRHAWQLNINIESYIWSSTAPSNLSLGDTEDQNSVSHRFWSRFSHKRAELGHTCISLLGTMRVKLYRSPLSTHGDFPLWTDQQKFCYLMKNESHEVANYLENAYNLRKSLLYRWLLMDRAYG